MFDEYLQPYLYKSVRNLNHSTQFDFLNGLNQLNISVNPELNNIYQNFGSFYESRLKLSIQYEPLFLSTFSNYIIDSLVNTDLPLLVPFETLTEEQKSQIYDVKPAMLKVIKLTDQPLSSRAIKRLALLGMNTNLPIICSDQEMCMFNKLELTYELIHQFDCWTFKFNMVNHTRNSLSIFDRDHMQRLNLIANDLLGVDLGIFSFLFNQKVRGDFAKRLDNIEDIEIAVHASELADDSGDLFFHVGYQENSFKSQFFKLLDQDLLASTFYLKKYIDTKQDYKVLDFKQKSNNIMSFLLLYFALYQKDALNDINQLFQTNSDVNHQTILNKIFSCFDNRTFTSQPLSIS
ncbi:hypothetical protein MW388_003150 [Acinetobacter baumannii]|nr:hypothetical protein [Acinetobacter baumannii]